MKTYAPKCLHGAMLRGLLDDLQATPAQAARYLHVTERSVWRWLADDSAPFAALAALWFETDAGRRVVAVDVGNALTIERGLSNAQALRSDDLAARLARLASIADTGAANDAFLDGPTTPGGFPGRPKRRPGQQEVAQARPDYLRLRN